MDFSKLVDYGCLFAFNDDPDLQVVYEFDRLDMEDIGTMSINDEFDHCTMEELVSIMMNEELYDLKVEDFDDDEISFLSVGSNDDVTIKEYPLVGEHSVVGKMPLDSSARYKKQRYITPLHKIATDLRPADVICQRGGLANKHVGNIHFRSKRDVLAPAYKFATNRMQKAAIRDLLVEAVHSRGGRFVAMENNAKGNRSFYEVDASRARYKSSQALREDTSQERQRKKKKLYGKHH